MYLIDFLFVNVLSPSCVTFLFDDGQIARARKTLHPGIADCNDLTLVRFIPKTEYVIYL